MARVIIARRYAVIAALAGSLLGVILGVLSAVGALDSISPLARGAIGVVAGALLGVLVAPVGAGFKYRLGTSLIVEAALTSALSTIVVWPVVYAVLAG